MVEFATRARAHLDEILAQCIETNASDLHLTAGTPAYARIDNHVVPLAGGSLSPELVEQMAHSLMNEAQRQTFAATHSLDLAFFSPLRARFRVNVFRQRGTVAMSIRRLDEEFRSLDDLLLPPQLQELGQLKHGLVVVTGPTGSGKSTTLATLIHQINLSRASHIITIEDPIEYVHKNHRSLVRQREVHSDVHCFASALKAALREDPDVILLGEMRDLETMRAAIVAAETGHLVFSTLHTGDAAGAVGRMVGVFPAEEQATVRDQLSRVLRAVVAQRLLPHKSGAGRVPAVEILRATAAVTNLIRVGDMRQINSIIQSGRDDGMLAFEESLALLTAHGLLAYDEALLWAREESVFESRLKLLQNSRAVAGRR